MSVFWIVVCVATALFCATGLRAQQASWPPPAQDFSETLAKARQLCQALWSDHVFDPLRNKIPLGGGKPTVAMLMNRDHILPKDRNLAELALKTFEKCRILQAAATALLPEQTRLRLQGFDREEDALMAQLLAGKLSFGDFNVRMNGIAAEELQVFFGDARPDATVSNQRSIPVPRPRPVSDGGVNTTPAMPLQSKRALVIGNGKYVNLPGLTNATNDARAMSEGLRGIGFEVTLVLDASEQQLRRDVRTFARDTSQADIALVFYAGHGAQVNGENFLLPVDIDVPRTETDIGLTGFKVDDLVNGIRSETKIVFLDACRDNPALFKNIVKGRGAASGGLAPANGSNFTNVKQGGGVFIAYATDAGSVASDGEGQHSPFTQALLRNLQKSVSIDDMFSLVTREVRLVTKNVQRPYKYASLENIVCLTGRCGQAAPETAVDDIAQEAKRSETEELHIALQTDNADALEAYLKKYPESPERDKLTGSLSELKRKQFQEWTLFELSSQRFPHYLKVASIHPFGDKVSFQYRSMIDPTVVSNEFSKFPDGSFEEQAAVVDCKRNLYAVAERTITSPSGQVLFHNKRADPELLNMSLAQAPAPGSVASTAERYVCDESLRTPLVDKRRLAAMTFSYLSTSPSGDGDLYYESLQSDDSEQRELLYIFKSSNDRDAGAALTPPREIPGAANVRTSVSRLRIKCAAEKYIAAKTEHYDASGKLVLWLAVDLSKDFTWTEISDNSPMEMLRRIACGAQEAQK